MEVTLQETVIVEFADRLGAKGHVMVNGCEYTACTVVSDRETVPAKLLTLVRETDMDPSLPRLMFVGATLIAKSPTCTVDMESCEALPRVPVPVTVI